MTYVKPIFWHSPKPPKSNRIGKILKNFATVVLCYPLTHRVTISAKSKVFKFLALVIQIFFSLVVSVISLDGIVNKTFNPSPQTSPLSVEIEILLFYLGSTLPDALVRISSLFLYRDIIELVDRIESLETINFHVVGRERKIFLLVSNIFLCSAWFIVCLISTVQLELNLVLREDLKLYLLPHDEVVVKSVYIFSDTWAMIAALYGWIFYIYVGICLVSQLENFTVNCESLLGTVEGASCIDGRCGSSSSSSDTRRIFQFMDEFEGIKSSYECFGRVGGTYALSLLVLFVLNTVGVLSYAMNGLSGEGDYDYSVGNYIYVCFPSIVSIIYFGDYVTNSVKSYVRRLYELEAKVLEKNKDQISRFIEWLGRWRWKFSALGLFDVDCGSLPGVVATVITYFIFLFQMKASESRQKQTIAFGNSTKLDTVNA